MNWPIPRIHLQAAALALTLLMGCLTAHAQSSRRVSDETIIFNDLKSGVVTVMTDTGRGSGFVVDAQRGLVVTNSHVVGRAMWYALRFDTGHSYLAQLIHQDVASDIAILRYNPQIQYKPVQLPLINPKSETVAFEGERVLVIGSPLDQDKSLAVGVVSKYDGNMIMTDAQINPGNSGGPLVNMDKKVAGICTFLVSESSEQGYGGVISIAKAIPVIEAARGMLGYAEPPSVNPLPDAPKQLITAPMLEAAAKGKKLEPIWMQGVKNFNLTISTPFVYAWQTGDARREHDKERGKRRGGARASTEDFTIRDYEARRATVSISFTPQLKEQGSSVVKRVLGTAATAVIGIKTPNVAKMKYRADFLDMELYVNGKLVPPIRRFRHSVGIDSYQMSSIFSLSTLYVDTEDSATAGTYEYDPMLFYPKNEIVIQMRDAYRPNEWHKVEFERKAQNEIWKQFAPWRDAAGITVQ
ncbi:MAG: S1C family serine protease [Armatimonadota bacterium]